MRLAWQLNQLTRSSAAENSVLTVEPLLLDQAHRTQGRAPCSLAPNKDRARQKRLAILPTAL
jgi:hypothetical protein